MADFNERTGVGPLLARHKEKIERLKHSDDQDVRDFADLAEYFSKSARGRAMTVEFLFYKALLRGETVAEISDPQGMSFTRRTDAI